MAIERRHWISIFLVVGMLVTGSLNTLAAKAQNQTSSVGTDGISEPFSHPFVQSWFMFIGELSTIFVLIYVRYKERKSAAERQDMKINDNGDAVPNVDQPRLIQLVCAAPACCDIFGTTLGNLGLLYIDASIWQMLRGAIIIFTGILSVIFLKRKLGQAHLVGMAIVIVGLIMVGLSSVLGAPPSGGGAGKQALGIGLVLAGQLFAATQMVVEETVLKKYNLPPMQVVSNEGLVGLSIMSVVVLPAVFFIPGDQTSLPAHLPKGSFDNAIDAFVQIANSGSLLAFTIIFVLSIAFYNSFGLAVTQRMTAVHRTLVDACRTLIVWVVSLLIYYTVSESFGEEWTKYSPLQLAGFLFLAFGTFVYNNVIRLPCLTYSTVPSEADGTYTAEKVGGDDLESKALLSPE